MSTYFYIILGTGLNLLIFYMEQQGGKNNKKNNYAKVGHKEVLASLNINLFTELQAQSLIPRVQKPTRRPWCHICSLPDSD